MTCVKKLLVLPAFGVSDRMRPGFGRKRNSSSALKDTPPAGNAENRPVSGHGAGRNPVKPRRCAMTRRAASKTKVPPAPPQNSVQTRACPETAAARCRFPLSCPLNRSCLARLCIHRRFSFGLRSYTLFLQVSRCFLQSSSSDAPCTRPRFATGCSGCISAAPEPSQRIFPSD